MELKTSKITNIQGAGTWDADFGLMYKYDVALENGDSGEYMSKKYTSVEALPFKIGDNLEYEFHNIKPNDEKFPKIKKPLIAGSKRWTPDNSYNGKSFGGGKSDEVQKLIVKQSCLERSIELLSHNMPSAVIKSSTVLELASQFTEWVMDGYNIKETPQPDGNWTGDTPIVEKTPEPVVENNDTNDLPF